MPPPRAFAQAVSILGLSKIVESFLNLRASRVVVLRLPKLDPGLMRSIRTYWPVFSSVAVRKSSGCSTPRSSLPVFCAIHVRSVQVDVCGLGVHAYLYKYVARTSYGVNVDRMKSSTLACSD